MSEAREATPVAETGGFRSGAYREGRLTAEIPAGGGSRGAIAAFGERVLSALLAAETGREPFGVDLKVNYVGRPEAGGLRAEARLVHRTRRTALVECDIEAGGRVVARVAGTYLLEA